MFFRVVILVFAATCCTAQVIEFCGFPSAWERSGKFEGDIVLTDGQQRNGLIDPESRWPNGEVPYFIDSVFNKDEQNQIMQAIDEYHRMTPIRFRQYDPLHDTDYIHITGEDSGCSSYVGRKGGRQQLNLQRDQCMWHGLILHEFQHALGFHHQHRAPDRDDYITIQWQNIQAGQEHNFEIFNANTFTSFGVPYDYDSIMHYGPCEFTGNGFVTIVPLDPNAQIGQRTRLSLKDIEKLARMYEDSSTTTTENSSTNTTEDSSTATTENSSTATTGDSSTATTEISSTATTKNSSTATTENSSPATGSQFITLIIVTLLVLTHLQ